MQLDSVTELLGIANYKVAYMVRNSKERTDLVLRRIEETPCVCSGCGKVHHTPVHSTDTVIVAYKRQAGFSACAEAEITLL